MQHSHIEFNCENLYIIGDLHLAVNIENKSMDKFSFYENYMEKLEKSLSVLDDNDILIVCGDICWGKRLKDAIPSLDFLERFKGRKILFKGNHDYWFEKISTLNNLYENIYFTRNKEIVVNNIPFVMQKGYYVNEEECDETAYKLLDRELYRIKTKISSYKKQGYRGEDIVVALHYPPILKKDIHSFENKGNLNILNCILKENIGTCYYGHLHSEFGLKQKVNSKILKTNFKCVSADLVGFKLQKIL